MQHCKNRHLYWITSYGEILNLGKTGLIFWLAAYIIRLIHVTVLAFCLLPLKTYIENMHKTVPLRK